MRRQVLGVLVLTLIVTAIAVSAFAQTPAPTLDPTAVQTAIVDQANAMKAVVLAILGVVLAIAAGRALFKRFARA